MVIVFNFCKAQKLPHNYFHKPYIISVDFRAKNSHRSRQSSYNVRFVWTESVSLSCMHVFDWLRTIPPQVSELRKFICRHTDPLMSELWTAVNKPQFRVWLLLKNLCQNGCLNEVAKMETVSFRSSWLWFGYDSHQSYLWKLMTIALWDIYWLKWRLLHSCRAPLYYSSTSRVSPLCNCNVIRLSSPQSQLEISLA